jgi:hypothetical protein
MRAYSKMEVELHQFLTSAINGGGGVCPRAGLHAYGKEEMYYPYRESNQNWTDYNIYICKQVD